MDLLAQSWNLLPALPRTLIAFALVLGVLVFIHELGHYLAARWRGVHVDAFSIGFGRPLWRRTDRRGTEWRLGWLPLGGYVKLHGLEVPEETDAADARLLAPRPDLPRQAGAGPRHRGRRRAGGELPARGAALRRPVHDRGPAGREHHDRRGGGGIGRGARRPARRRRDPGARRRARGALRPGAAPRPAAPRPADRNADRARRGGADAGGHARRARGAAGRATGVLGIQGGAVRLERLGPVAALAAGAAQTVDVTWQSLTSIGEMLAGQRSARDLGGPIRIAEISGEAATLGPAALVSLMALLSVSLGLLNLFPIPILDGGHLVFYAAEAHPRPAAAAEGAGVRLPRRLRAAGHLVRAGVVERHRPRRHRPVRRAPRGLSATPQGNGAGARRGGGWRAAGPPLWSAPSARPPARQPESHGPALALDHRPRAADRHRLPRAGARRGARLRRRAARGRPRAPPPPRPAPKGWCGRSRCAATSASRPTPSAPTCCCSPATPSTPTGSTAA